MPGMNTGLEGTHRKYDTSIFERSTLGNGVTVWLQKNPILTDDSGIIVGCLPGIGSVRDPANALGAAHFFEHIPFLGTEKYPNQQLVWGAVEDLGGDLNASTGLQSIKYRCTLPKDELMLAADRVFQLMAKPLFRDEVIINERGTILAEWRRKHANGDAVSGEALWKIYWEDSPLGNPVLGTPNSIASMVPADLKEFFLRYFLSGNLHVIIGGTFAERRDSLSVVSDLFGSLPASPSTPPHASPPFFTARNEVLADPGFGRDRLHFIWNFEGDEMHEGRLLCNHLAGEMTSPLMLAFRSRLGAIYETGWAHCDLMCGTTFLGVSIPISREHFAYAYEQLFLAIRQITPEDVVRHQKIAQWRRAYHWNHPVRATIEACDDLIDHGCIRSHGEDESRIDGCTIERVLALRDRLLNEDPFVCETIK